MHSLKTVIGLLLALLVISPSFVSAGIDKEEAAKIFILGKELLKKGDFEGALKAYGEAARCDSMTVKYRQQYMLLRKVMKMRTAIIREENPQKWQRLAKGLRNFYYSNRLYSDLVTLTRKIHEKKNSVESATVLADALLLHGENAEAVKVLTDQKRENLSLHAKVLLGISLGRQKKIEEAHALLDGLAIPEKPSPRFLCDVARLKVLAGDVAGGMVVLTTALESTAPRALSSFKDFVKNTLEFKNLPASANLIKVLKTKSKVSESACSSGSSCGSCPRRGSCPGSKKK